MFTVPWTPEATQTYDELRETALCSVAARKNKAKSKSSEDEGLFKQIHKTIELLKSNPKHPGLKTHEHNSIANSFDGEKKVVEAYARNNTPGALRVFWCYGPGLQEITIIAITPHP